MPRHPRRTRPPALSPGDHVLCGMPGISRPSDWYFATVLWADAADVAIEHGTFTGQNVRSFIDRSHVRAVGTDGNLVTLQREAREAVADLERAVSDAETALGRARQAVWDKLDEYVSETGAPLVLADAGEPVP